MSDMFEDMFDEGDALSRVNKDTGTQLSSLVRQLREVEDKISEAEEYVKEMKQQQRALSMDSIPSLMDEMGLERVDVDGLIVSRKMIVKASIPLERKEEAFAWLRDNKFGDIIKNDVTCSFAMGEDNVAGDVVGILQDRGFSPTTKTHIHPSTLSAFVKERLVGGNPIDLDMFGAFVNNSAQIKRKA